MLEEYFTMVGKKVSLRCLEMLRVGNNYLLCKLHSHFETIWVGLKTSLFIHEDIYHYKSVEMV